jgi:predicted double-glycine peptidase
MQAMATRTRRVALGLCVMAMVLAARAPLAHAQGTPARAAASDTVAPSHASGALGPLVNIAQTWNNCGPASLAEVLAYWGISRTQGQIQAVLRVDGPTRGMTPYGVPAYARRLGMRALVGIGGTEALVKALISNGFPVIVSQQVSITYRIGHYRPIEAYDDRQGTFVASDPYLGAPYRITYADFARIWASSDRGFMVLYPPARQAVLSAVLASVGWDSRRAYQHDLALAQARLRHPHQSTARESVMMTGQSAHFRSYGYLRLAWDELQLGREAMARRALAQAAKQGANPIVVGWISQEIARQARV